MIQTLGDILLLVAILSLGLVAFLLAVLLYHLIFVVMDLRQVMRRCNAVTKEIEEMIVKPVEAISSVIDWVEKHVWAAYFADEPKNSKKKRKKKSKKSKRRVGGFEKKRVEG